MEEKKVVPAGSFCWNTQCADSGQVEKGNIRKSGKTDKGVQRYQCKTCKKTWTETKGTLFYRCRHSRQTIVECLAMLGDRKSLAAIHRIKGVKEETVGQWVERAATHVEQIEDQLGEPCPLSRVQLDALWTYVGHKGEKGGGRKKRNEARFGVEPPLTWIVGEAVGRAVAKTEEEAAAVLMTQVKRHTPDGRPPAMATDGKGGYRQAMLQTWGQVPDYSGRGRPATLPKPGKDWQSLQAVKKRQGSRLVRVQSRLVYGDPEEVKAALGAHTAYVERTHLTSRQMNGRLVRKTLSFSKQTRLLDAASSWEDGLYNFTRPLKTLRLQMGSDPTHPAFLPRTPALAAGLTDHVWTCKELLTTVLVPLALNT